MKNICFYFQIHQPHRLKRYRFFNIGGDHYYYDDFANEDFIQQVAEVSFVPANRVILDMIKEYKGKFKAAFSISGVALDQLEIYAPEVIDGFRELADTGCVEFLAETQGHSLASLIDPEGFKKQVKDHSDKIESLFGQKPKVFRNTELIFSDEIAELVHEMGFIGMLTPGAKRTLGWKSPNYVYQSAAQPKLKLLMRNPKFSDDIATRFSNYNWSEYPLTADKFINWIAATPKEEQAINLFMNYEALGNFQKRSSGIFDFLKALPRFAAEKNIGFATPSEVLNTLKPVGSISSMHPISWVGEERDVSPWLGNTLQQEAFHKLYEIAERVNLSQSRRLIQDWIYLQSSDHFYYMGTKNDLPFSPFPSPYEAFNTYMNVLSDFKERVEAEFPSSIETEELNALLTTIHNQADEIDRLEETIKKLETKGNPVPAAKESKAAPKPKAAASKPKAKLVAEKKVEVKPKATEVKPKAEEKPKTTATTKAKPAAKPKTEAKPKGEAKPKATKK
ncbi:alpha-amylase [Dysgonomonas sp. PFB1-18]|uniref:glycoside hydrolase family 57 protein n=1 Tax=unclassified Dysgonomonas TaxID=2630389 RepID=UPI002473C437|nr:MULTISPECIES: polysaccharide deacetylase family protein [unclassified Dysgonomonas]MDH6307562.1 alpha-amylase [Dysgonomonas sp. PF1-14]MDH6337480.1 alpha-amylase [Dysgonomonas sp. PF1-16]MDH6378705.1 alpha-amylase [Dysgonomonas sp. PFB1-18]MDH6399123.1 alpha-amylase [Dysgonomonas sp. PF1-23]